MNFGNLLGNYRDYSDIPEIVFVHLGDSPCIHLWKNLERTQNLFPEMTVNIVIDSKKHLRNIPKQVRVIYWNTEDAGIEWRGSRDLVFRRGFWKHSLNRLFALNYCHQEIGQRAILHVESDVLLLPNFPWERFANLEKIYWQPYNEERDVASLLYSPGPSYTKLLQDALLDAYKSNASHTDMTILRQISRDNILPNGYLPIIDSGNLTLLNANYQGEVPWIRQERDSIFNDGLFDSAAIGMWLLGHDPRNSYGQFLIHDESLIVQGNTPVDSRKLNLEMSNDGNLYLKGRIPEEADISIWSLHIHSKELAIFGQNWQESLNYYVKLARIQPGLIKKFRVKAVWSMWVDNLATGTPLKFFAGIPFVHRVRGIIYKMKKTVIKLFLSEKKENDGQI
jgi:hypothetical protein